MMLPLESFKTFSVVVVMMVSSVSFSVYCPLGFHHFEVSFGTSTGFGAGFGGGGGGSTIVVFVITGYSNL